MRDLPWHSTPREPRARGGPVRPRTTAGIWPTTINGGSDPQCQNLPLGVIVCFLLELRPGDSFRVVPKHGAQTHRAPGLREFAGPALQQTGPAIYPTSPRRTGRSRMSVAKSILAGRRNRAKKGGAVGEQWPFGRIAGSPAKPSQPIGESSCSGCFWSRHRTHWGPLRPASKRQDSSRRSVSLLSQVLRSGN